MRARARRIRRAPRPVPKAPDRYLTRRERLTLRTSKLWIAGYPELVAEWHPTRNVDLYPYQVSHGSNLRVWWKCPKGRDHEWEEKAADRVPRNGRPARGCPFCAGRRFSVTNSLKARFPKLAAEWHPTKNAELSPANVIATAAKVVWWKCKAGPDHEWRESVRHRTRTETHCPFCRGVRLSVTNSLEGRAPKLAREWHPSKNGRLLPSAVKHGDGRAVWWKCPEGPDHEWRATIRFRVLTPTCPFCRGSRLSVTNSLAAKHPAIAKQWHPTKNGALSPAQVSSSHPGHVWWRCSKGPDHEWKADVAGRVFNKRGCPFCAGQAVSVTNSLAARAKAAAALWDAKRNGRRATEVHHRSKLVAHWCCARGHRWQAKVEIQSESKRGCSTCASIAGRHPEAVREWHPTKNGALKPSEVMPGSRRTIWWRCGKRHEWVERPLTRFRRGSGCPICEGRRYRGPGLTSVRTGS